MATIEQIVEAVLQDDNLLTRTLVQEFLRNHPILTDIPKPEMHDAISLTVAAALLELFSLRTQQAAPDWTQRVGPAEEPRYLLRSVTTMRRLRDRLSLIHI